MYVRWDTVCRCAELGPARPHFRCHRRSLPALIAWRRAGRFGALSSTDVCKQTRTCANDRNAKPRQAGQVLIEPKADPGAYHREVFLVLKEFKTSFSRGGHMGYEVGYERFAIKARC
jgi:hypothetical protein